MNTNQYMQDAEAFTLKHHPAHRTFGFTAIYPGSVFNTTLGTEFHRGCFKLTHQQHCASAEFLISDFDRMNKTYDLTIISLSGETLLETSVKFDGWSKGDVWTKNVQSASGLDMSTNVVMVHRLIIEQVTEHGPDCGPVVCPIDWNSRKWLERLEQSDWETIVSSMQMLTNP